MAQIGSRELRSRQMASSSPLHMMIIQSASGMRRQEHRVASLRVIQNASMQWPSHRMADFSPLHLMIRQSVSGKQKQEKQSVTLPLLAISHVSIYLRAY